MANAKAVISCALTGTLTDGPLRAEMLGDRFAVPGAARKSPFAGKYTLILSGNGEDAAGAIGDGYGAVTVDVAGMLHLNGALSDGTVISQEVALAPNGVWAVYIPLYGGKGLLSGWVAFHREPSSDLAGRLHWLKPGSTVDKKHAEAWTRDLSVLGSSYLPTAVGAGNVDQPRAAVAFSGGTLPELIANLVTIGDNQKISVVFDGGNKLKLSLAPATGLFSGSFVHPVTHATTVFDGAWLQRLNLGSGYFLDAGRSGHVFFGAETNKVTQPEPRPRKR